MWATGFQVEFKVAMSSFTQPVAYRLRGGGLSNTKFDLTVKPVFTLNFSPSKPMCREILAIVKIIDVDLSK